MLKITWSGRIDDAVRAVGQHPLVRDEDVVERDAVAGGAAHAEAVPVVEDGHAVRRDRHGHVQHPAALLGIVVGEHRRHHRPGRRLAAEHLAARHEVAAVDLGGLAARVGLIGAAGGDEHDALVGHPAQGRLGPGHVTPVPPGGEGDDVLVHRGGQSGGAAVVGQLALDGGDVADGAAAAAELGRHADGEQPGLAEGPKALVHEGAVAVVDRPRRRRSRRPRTRRSRRRCCCVRCR